MFVAEGFGADHARLDVLFEDARRFGALGRFPSARSAFDEFVRGLERHITVEEQQLFPLFDDRAGMRGPTMVMRHEHRAIEQLLAKLDASLEAENAALFASEAAELAAILQAHNLKEERILYPRSDGVLDDAERAALLAAIG